MSSIDVNSQLANLNPSKTNRFATEPITLEDLVCKAVESESVMKRTVDEMFREYADSSAKHSAVVATKMFPASLQMELTVTRY